jgi:hypothetical protein
LSSNIIAISRKQSQRKINSGDQSEESPAFEDQKL